MRSLVRRSLLSLVVAAALVALPACKNNGQRTQSGAAPGAAAPAATVAIAAGARQLTFRVELALTPAEQERGLMYRQSLAPDAGMLFVFDRQSVHTFWMKNTLIPLDMLFIDADRRIVGIVASAEPLTETGRSVGLPSQYVLEIGGGLSGQLGIRAGQTVDFQGVPPP